ncbi:RNA 3'-terminal phosphate cyclase [Noviherbaspirillum cavernae]|uniref:RNA 3'-terminal phosphate cyclase n=1 Tax=Noviherbaspirillum cavernae TaxID=2320862 RepID=A0A418X5I6_9BURK|nr:RNA 3'-terminal phosphate cyclase [Noviherbaspirillum cavernae]RJG07732.1 RNA 3'-terminal phosphate cyclase [Noviherbaspirillum cavernae]
MIELDGSMGEGGGQILRTALTLSMITGQPFCIRNIRANRAKPGLMRQHLVAVQAAAQVCDAEVAGAAVGSRALSFAPKAIRGGAYRFAIGTAGSCTLVLQTLLPALLFADTPATVHVSGGTHNPLAPPAQFLQRAYCRALTKMGATLDIRLERFGFYPAGGGEVVAHVQPCAQLRPLELMSRGERKAAYAECFIAGVPPGVARRELECVGTGMGWDASQLLVRTLPGEQGPGNALLITLDYEHVIEVFSGFGEKSVRAEAVARHALQQARHYIASHAAVGEYLADQLMLPMALAGGGCFTTARISMHAKTNAQVIEYFLPVSVSFGENGGISTCVMAKR